MTLTQYLAEPGAMTARALAKAMGVTPGRISQLKSRGNWSPELALAAELATGGKLDAALLHPTIAMARQQAGLAA